MSKILILYFSGVGATKKVAELMYELLSLNCEADIFSVESKDIPCTSGYDALIIGTPVYHAAPARLVISYLDTLPISIKELPAFVFNTCGLFSLNTNRIVARRLQQKNIITVMDRAYRGPASDGSIIAPFIKRFFEFEKNIENKIARDCASFLKELKKDVPHGYIPGFRFGGILNAPNKGLGRLITVKIHLHKNLCVKCGHCVKSCPHKAFSTDENGYPLFASKNCENCYRCIHHCPSLALSPGRKPVKKTLKGLLP